MGMVKPDSEVYPAYKNMTQSPCSIFSSISGGDHCQFEKQSMLEYAACTLIETTMGCGPAIRAGAQQDLSVKYVSMFADYVTKGSQDALSALQDSMNADVSSGTLAAYENSGCSSHSV